MYSYYITRYGAYYRKRTYENKTWWSAYHPSGWSVISGEPVFKLEPLMKTSLTKRYKCHKEVFATPMTLGAYNLYRGWELPLEEDGSRLGYLVEYVSKTSGPNHPDHEGYISWSPFETLKEGYTEMD